MVRRTSFSAVPATHAVPATCQMIPQREVEATAAAEEVVDLERYKISESKL